VLGWGEKRGVVNPGKERKTALRNLLHIGLTKKIHGGGQLARWGEKLPTLW